MDLGGTEARNVLTVSSPTYGFLSTEITITCQIGECSNKNGFKTGEISPSYPAMQQIELDPVEYEISKTPLEFSIAEIQLICDHTRLNERSLEIFNEGKFELIDNPAAYGFEMRDDGFSVYSEDPNLRDAIFFVNYKSWAVEEQSWYVHTSIMITYRLPPCVI